MTVTGNPAHRLGSEESESSVHFDETGNVIGIVRRDGETIPVAPDGSGLRVENAETGEEYPVNGEMSASGEELSQFVDVPDGALAVNVVYRFVDDQVMEVEGAVTDVSETDRVFDVVFSLSLDRQDGEWIGSIESLASV